MEQIRQKEIIHILLNEKDYITISQLSAQLKVSGKTIRNDLAQIGSWLSGNRLVLIKKTGVGIRIEGSKEDKLSAINLLSTGASHMEAYSPEARKIYIALRLITCEDSCRIYELAEELFVSRATIHKDLSSLAGILEEHHIKLVRKNNNGVQLAGKERFQRDMMLHLMEEDGGYGDFMEIVQNPGYACRDSFIFDALDYTDRDMCRFVRLFLGSGNSFIRGLPFRSLLNVLLRLFICFIRMLDGRFVMLSPQFIQELGDKPLYPEACAAGELISVEYGLEIPQTELRYIQVHFLSMQNHPDNVAQEQEEAVEVAKMLLASWENTFHYPFGRDKALLSSLSAHLEPAITRFRHGIAIENPMMYEIKSYYRNTFLITRESVRCIEERFGCRVSDDEAGYLAIYLATALERIKQPLSTIVVSHGGKGAAELLLVKLSRQIPEINITSLESFISVQQADLTGTELILSTLSLPLKTQIPIVRITPVLSYQDILRLKDVVSAYYTAKNNPLLDPKKDI